MKLLLMFEKAVGEFKGVDGENVLVSIPARQITDEEFRFEPHELEEMKQQQEGLDHD